jgi:hypothetical protein
MKTRMKETTEKVSPPSGAFSAFKCRVMRVSMFLVDRLEKIHAGLSLDPTHLGDEQTAKGKSSSGQVCQPAL